MEQFKFDGIWEKEYQFDAFKGLQNRRGPYASVSSSELSNGTILLTINDDLTENPDPYPEQLEAINFILRNPGKLKDSMRNGIDKIYEDLKTQYGYQEEDEEHNKWFPNITKIEDYDKVFGVANIFVQIPSKNGLSYVGIECGCSWDDEHGLGFLFHGDKLIKIGTADEAFSWEAYRDNGTIEEVKASNKIIRVPKKHVPHPKYGLLKPIQKSANESFEIDLIRGGFSQIFINNCSKGEININGSWKSHDQTYFETAIASKNFKIINYLLEQDVEIRYAIFNCAKDLELIDLLLDGGGKINQRDKSKNTLIYQSTLEMVTLFDHRNQSIKHDLGREKELTTQIVNLQTFINELRKRGADIQIPNSYGFNCLVASRNLSNVDKVSIDNFFKDDWAEQLYLTKTVEKEQQLQLDNLFENAKIENKKKTEVEVENKRGRWKFWKLRK